MVLGDVEYLDDDKSFMDDGCFDNNKASVSKFNLEYLESHQSEENGHEKTQNIIDANNEGNNNHDISMDKKSIGRKNKNNEYEDEFEQNGLLQFSEENIE